MELTSADIERITSLGHSDFYFDDNGERILRNINGHCFFLKDGDCIIYKYKPKGCTLYPLIMSLPGRVPMMDEDCPHRHLFKFDPDDIIELSDLIDELERS